MGEVQLLESLLMTLKKDSKKVFYNNLKLSETIKRPNRRQLRRARLPTLRSVTKISLL